MELLIIGGGRIGYYLAGKLSDNGYNVTVIEKDINACRRFANEPDVTVILGDGTSLQTLRSAGAEKIRSVIAVTGRDEDNLIACQLAKRVFGAEKTIAKVNNPKNVAALEQLGVDIVVNSTDYIITQLERKLDSGKMEEMLSVSEDVSVFEMVLDESFGSEGVPLSQLNIPNTVNIISVIGKNGRVAIPRGMTTLERGDRLMVIADKKHKNDIFKVLKMKK